MDTVGEVQLITDNIEEQFVGQASAFCIFWTSVYNFLQEDMPVGIVG
jgi:hypothetical protein